MDRLDAYIESWRNKTFDWSTAHCCHFAAGWVSLVEGWDPIKDLPELKDQKSAAKLVEVYGSLPIAVTQFLKGREAQSALLAGVGDIVFMCGQPNGSLGICNGRRAFFLTEEGVRAASMATAVLSWRIGAAP